MSRFPKWPLGFALSVVGLFAVACSEETRHPVGPGDGTSAFSPLATLSAEFNQYDFLGFVPDDAGVNDVPAQSDLNAFTRADNVSGKIGVKWVWDDINSWTGSGQTGDACALFDTDNDGKANAAVCVRINNPGGNPDVTAQLSPGSPLNYTCGDSKQDRCASPVRPVATTGIVCEVEKLAGETFFTAGDDNADVLAACSIPLSAISAQTVPNLINVCSFPSGSPQSNPFDCVVTPGAGFMILKKATTPQTSGETFSFTIDPAPIAGASYSLSDVTSGDEQTALLSTAPGAAYTVTEGAVPTGWSLTTASCVRQTTPTPTPTGTLSGQAVNSISITSGETTVCTFANSRDQGTIEVKKTWVGVAGQTTLTIGTSSGGAEIASQLTGAAGAEPLTTGAQAVNTATYYVSETGGLADYGAQLSCTNKGNSITPGANNSVPVASGDAIVCTFTNTRNQGSIELRKAWVGTGGQTTLRIGTSANAADISSQQTGSAGASPLTTGAKSVNTGTYYVSEDGGLGDYAAQLACTKNGDPLNPGTNNSVAVATGDVLVCTFTNTRNQGSIELKKAWIGAGGQTTLKIGTSSGGSETASQQTGAAGAAPLTTGAKSVNTGTYYVSEDGGLGDYAAQLACTSNGNPVNPGAGNSVSVATGDVVVCTFTNTRNQGTIEVRKTWVGTAGQTTLNIGTSASGSQVASQLTGASGAAPLTTGAKSVNTGTFYVSEEGGLGDYASQLACTSNGNPINPGANNSVSISTGEAVVCTFTNTRNQGSIELKKVWIGEGGQTTLKIGTSAGGSETASQQTGASGAAPLSSGAKTVNTGTYYVSETDGLAAYTSQLACTSNGNPVNPGASNSVSVATGDVVVCTFTNTAVPPTISVVKTATPNSVAETGGSITYSVTVTNSSSIAVMLASLIDDQFGDLNGQGTCNKTTATANPYGSIAAGGNYSCSFSRTLAASDAGQTHINEVTASVSSDGGPGTAKDTAKVTYTNVLPDITVTKSADVTSFTASGGISVAGFTADQVFTGSGGGGGGSTPTFSGQVCDDGGVNDEPAQSDLNCFSRADNIAGRMWTRWTWDDINSWTGSGQTGDACTLIDTDNDGNANFAFCARITNPNGDPSVIVQVAGSPILYQCSDNAPDRCTSKTSIKQLNASSVCAISQVAEQFPAEGDDGFDIQAECDLRLLDLSNTATNANVDLLNVCSFPSGSPNSNPFDCVVTPASGFLVIAEVTSPASSATTFGFVLRNAANTANAAATNGFDEFGVAGGATSAGIPMARGTYAIQQLMPTNWNLTSITCTRDGITVANGTTSPQSNITIVSGQTTICTFNNSLTGSQSVTFTVTVTNNSAEAVWLFSLEDAESSTAADPTSYSTLNNVGTCVTGGSIAGGGIYTCTFSRTISGAPGVYHKDRVRAVGNDNENYSDTEVSGIVTVTIN